MAVAAYNGHARKSAALLGRNNVHDALVFVTHGVNGDVECCSVFVEHFKLTLRDGVFNREVDVLCWHVVVGSCNGEVGAAHGATSEAQTFECLRACYFMHQVQVDVHEVGFAVAGVNDVAFPHFFGESFW